MTNRNRSFPSGPTSSWAGLLLSLGITALAAVLGGIASTNAPVFYESLAKPVWAPPPWVFGPVWTLLYCLMSVAAWLVWKEHGTRGSKAALSLYLVQLVLNGLWSWLFFRWRSGGWALLEILVLWVVLLLTLVGFWRVRKAAGLLLVPYLAWVTFAAALMAAIWRRNPGLL